VRNAIVDGEQRSHEGLYRFYGGGVIPHSSITGPKRVQSSRHQRVAIFTASRDLDCD